MLVLSQKLGPTHYMMLTIELALQGITIADPNLPDCPLMYVNEAFCRMTGYDQDEILGRNCRFLQGPETDKATLARIRVAMQQVQPQSGTHRQRHACAHDLDSAMPVPPLEGAHSIALPTFPSTSWRSSLPLWSGAS